MPLELGVGSCSEVDKGGDLNSIEVPQSVYKVSPLRGFPGHVRTLWESPMGYGLFASRTGVQSTESASTAYGSTREDPKPGQVDMSWPSV